MEKTRRRLGMEERCGDALATVSANSGEALPWWAVVEMAGGPHLRTIGLAGRWRRSRRTLRSYGEGVARVFVAVHELGDGEAPRQQWRSSCASAAAAISWRSEGGRRRVSRQARGRGFKTEDTGQRRQASHRVWRPRGSRSLLPISHDRSKLRVSVFIESD